MDKNEPDLVEQLHRDAVQRRREQMGEERVLVEAMFREARERQRQEEEHGGALVESVHREAVENARRNPPPPAERPKGIHYTELPEAKPGDVLGREWNTYRRQVGRLLSEGRAGRFVLIKGEEILGIWDTHDEAATVGYQRFPGQPFFVHAIRAEEPYLRIRGVHLPWRTKIIR
jgi:hypothetical protein